MNYEHTLRPCPFCGGEELRSRPAGEWWIIQCLSCYSESGEAANELEAGKAWNTRPFEDEMLKALIETTKKMELESIAHNWDYICPARTRMIRNIQIIEKATGKTWEELNG